MVETQMQYEVAKKHVEMFQEALDNFDLIHEEPTYIHPILKKAQKDAIEYKLKELKKEVAEYEKSIKRKK